MILDVQLLQPNKSDALGYLDTGAAAPTRFGKATLQFGATEQPYIQEYMVGPLPVTEGQTTCVELNYIYNKGTGKQYIYNADQAQVAAFNIEVATGIQDITQDLLNGVSTEPRTYRNSWLTNVLDRTRRG